MQLTIDAIRNPNNETSGWAFKVVIDDADENQRHYFIMLHGFKKNMFYLYRANEFDILPSGKMELEIKQSKGINYAISEAINWIEMQYGSKSVFANYLSR